MKKYFTSSTKYFLIHFFFLSLILFSCCYFRNVFCGSKRIFNIVFFILVFVARCHFIYDCEWNLLLRRESTLHIHKTVSNLKVRKRTKFEFRCGTIYIAIMSRFLASIRLSYGQWLTLERFFNVKVTIFF